ncbi:hypothetical protein CTEN210_08634 [Chaetoceros tenuissimus]|uniref:Kinesin motor domain-containing protein n=1 Tax=Chaetoceros tenuissimus TaxID=426638 RepID=A0AAD3H6U7_9STRA|nr:hypothetical protein CTEN210_08634 [Chaetoceros tenuissimus]
MRYESSTKGLYKQIPRKLLVQCTRLARSRGLCNRHAGLLCIHIEEGVQCSSLAIKDGLCRHHSPRVFCSHQDEKGVQCTNLARNGGLCKRHGGKLCSHQDAKGVQCTSLAVKDGLCTRHSPTVFCSHQDEKGVQCTNVARSGGLCDRHAGNYCSHQDEKGVQCTRLAVKDGLCTRHSPTVFCSHQDEKGVQCTNVARSGGLCMRHAVFKKPYCNPCSEQGIVTHAVNKLFAAKDMIEDTSQGSQNVPISVSVELLEIYNEQVRDLLSKKKDGSLKSLSIAVNSNEATGNIIKETSSVKEVTAQH